MDERRDGKVRGSRAGSRRVFLRRHLMLSREFADMLLRGVKRSTIRLGIVIPKYDEVIVHSGGRPIAKARIAGVRYKKVHELADEDAKLDGFGGLGELLDALERTYKGISMDDDVTVIELEVVRKFDELRGDEVYHGLSPSDIARLGLRYLRRELSDGEVEILELLSRGLSIRGAASKLYGSPHRRFRVRRVVRRVLGELKSRGIIRVREEPADQIA